MGKITIDKNLIGRGWGLDFSGSSAGVEAEPGKYSASTAISLFRNGKIGQISPGEVFTNIGDSETRVTGLPINGVVDSAGEAFCILDNGRIVQFGTVDFEVDAAKDISHHSSVVGEDILTYKNSSDEYILYSFNDGTDGDVGRRTKSSGAYDDDFLSTSSGGGVLDKSVPHKMAVGPDKYIYITNGQYLVQLNPSTGVVIMQKLSLGTGYVATDLRVLGNFLVISGYKATGSITTYTKGEALVWFWNCSSTLADAIYDLNDNYVSAIYVKDGILYAFTQGINNTTKIKYYKNEGFETIFESSQIGNGPRPGSIELYQNMIHFTKSSGGNMYCLDGTAFHFRTAVTSDGSTASSDVGMVKNLASSYLCVGRKVGSSYYISYMGTNYYINADFKDSIRELPYKSDITKIIFYFSQFGTGASILASLFLNNATISIGGATDSLNQTLTNAANGSVSSISVVPTNAKDVNTFLLHIRFNHSSASSTAAIIRKIEVYYETQDKL